MADTFVPGAGARTPAGSLIAAPFAAFGRLLVRMAEASPRVREIERLNAQSDADLARRGTTRDAEIRRILGIYGTI